MRVSATTLDANGDGNIDVLVVNSCNGNDFYLGNGIGGWVRDTTRNGPGDKELPKAGERVCAVALDVNGDGRDDVFEVYKDAAREPFVYESDGSEDWHYAKIDLKSRVNDNLIPGHLASANIENCISFDANGDGRGDVLLLYHGVHNV